MVSEVIKGAHREADSIMCFSPAKPRWCHRSGTPAFPAVLIGFKLKSCFSVRDFEALSVL